MRKWRFTKPRTSATATALLALVCAVSAHCALLLFRYQTPAAKQKQDSSGIEVLNLSSLPRNDRRRIVQWITLHDPVRIAGSASKSGYSVHLPAPAPAGVRLHAYRNDLVRPVSTVPPFTPVPVTEAKFAPLPKPAAPPEIAPKAVRKVRVVDQNGVPVTDPVFAFSPGPGAARPSIIDVSAYGRVAGVTLRQSCGDPRLDKLAVAAASRMKTAGCTALIVIWPAAEVKK